MKLFTNPLETLYKPFGGPLQTRLQEFETLLKPGFTQIAMFNKTCFHMEGHIFVQEKKLLHKLVLALCVIQPLTLTLHQLLFLLLCNVINMHTLYLLINEKQRGKVGN